MRKVQDATKQRLHEYTANEKLRSFVYVNLGQIDSKVALKPSSWIEREKVMDYPTNFSSMSDENIRILSERGEVISRVFVTQYLFTD
jgi:hypothetical protein